MKHWDPPNHRKQLPLADQTTHMIRTLSYRGLRTAAAPGTGLRFPPFPLWPLLVWLWSISTPALETCKWFVCVLKPGPLWLTWFAAVWPPPWRVMPLTRGSSGSYGRSSYSSSSGNRWRLTGRAMHLPKRWKPSMRVCEREVL